MTGPADSASRAAATRSIAHIYPPSSSVRTEHPNPSRLAPGKVTSATPLANPVALSSVADLMAELAEVTAAIRRAREPASPEVDEVTTPELLALYRRECSVVRRLRRRRRQWRMLLRISDAALLDADPVGELA